KQEADLDEELKFHLAMQEQKNQQDGMSSEDAHRSALIEIGGAEQIKEQVRSDRFGFWFETILKDATYGIRMLRKTPAITFVSLVTLSLAIGACTALFSIFYTLLLSPLPYPQPDQLVQIWDTNLKKGITQIGVNSRNLLDWRQRVSGFNGIAGYYTMGRTLTSGSDSEVVLVSQVSADFFKIFRTQPLLGRIFSDAESRAAKFNQALGAENPDPVVILSHGLWIRTFGGDPKIIGKTIILERRAWKVVGVMPSQFAMPDSATQMWIPWELQFETMRDQHFATGVARLKDGITFSQASDRLNEVANQLATEFPDSNEGWNVKILPLHQAMTGDLKQLLWVLLAAVGLVLLLGCANVAILQLSRASARMHESSIRLALGASRSRLFRQFLIESLILAFAGGILGIGFAYFGIEGIQHLKIDLPRITEISLNQTVLFTSFGVTVVTALLFGLIPASANAQKNESAFHGESFRTTSNISTQRLRNVLVMTEVALAVVLLASSGMLIRSFAKLRAVNSGFNANNVLVLPIFLDMEKYGSGKKSHAYYKNLFENLQSLPGVVSVGGATALPTSPLGPDFERPVWDESNLAVEQNKRSADVRIVTPDYFRTLGISVLKGRGFTSQDGPDAPHVVIVNQTLAQKIWQNESPIGKKLAVDYSSAGTYAYEIVGVVNDIRFHGPRSEPRTEIYFPHAQKPYLVLNVAIRASVDPRLLINPVREVLHRIDPQKPAHNITPLKDLVAATVVRDRYATTLLSCFAIVALMLAMLGIYGVLAFFVRQKVQEIGIRLALGARQTQITSWIAKQGTRLMITGLVAGLLATLLFSRILAGILYEVSPLDLLSLLAAIFALTLSVVIAISIPAHRASRIDPSVALRYE
ncbi:MAG TPA: ABC transporter permease, partial [Acidobacteriota bacterium]